MIEVVLMRCSAVAKGKRERRKKGASVSLVWSFLSTKRFLHLANSYQLTLNAAVDVHIDSSAS